MNTQLLQNWLNGSRNYTVGALLYQQFGHDEALKKLFKTQKTSYSQSELEAAIEKLLKQPEPVKNDVPELSAFDEMPKDEADPVLLALYQSWIGPYTELNYKRHQLDFYLEDETDRACIIRGNLAREILELEKKCMAVWVNRDVYVKTGNLPGKSTESEAVIDPFHAAKRLSNLRIYITRYKNQLKKKPTNEAAAAKLMEFQKEYELLTKTYAR